MLDFICPTCGYLGFDNAVCASCGSSMGDVTEDSLQ
jgi:hypothetical protein